MDNMKFKFFNTLNVGGYFHQVRTVHIGYTLPININKFLNKRHEAGKIIVTFYGYDGTTIISTTTTISYDKMDGFQKHLKQSEKRFSTISKT